MYLVIKLLLEYILCEVHNYVGQDICFGCSVQRIDLCFLQEITKYYYKDFLNCYLKIIIEPARFIKVI